MKLDKEKIHDIIEPLVQQNSSRADVYDLVEMALKEAQRQIDYQYAWVPLGTYAHFLKQENFYGGLYAIAMDGDVKIVRFSFLESLKEYAFDLRGKNAIIRMFEHGASPSKFLSESATPKKKSFPPFRFKSGALV